MPQNFAFAAVYNIAAIPLAAFGLVSLGLLPWSLGSGQYDDLDGDAQRMLLPDSHDDAI